MITFKDYGYKRIFLDYDWGKFEGSLIGIDKKINTNLSIRGEKYNLNLFFTSIDINKTNVFIKKVQLLKPSKQVILEEKNKKLIFDVSKYSKKNIAFIFLKNIEIPIKEYSDLLLIVEFSIEGIDKLYKVEHLFVRSFKEEKISFWDKLMGI